MKARNVIEVVVELDGSTVDVLYLRRPGAIVASAAPGADVPLPAGVLPESVTAVTLASLDARGATQALDGAGGLRPIGAGEEMTLALGPMSVTVRAVEPGPAAPRRPSWTRGAVGLVAAVLAMNVVVATLLSSEWGRQGPDPRKFHVRAYRMAALDGIDLAAERAR